MTSATTATTTPASTPTRPARRHRSRHTSRTVALLVGLAAVVALPVAAMAGWTPPPDTIIDVRGNAADGFAIRHHDGSMLYPPTRSEARAECGEYSTRVGRVRCRTQVRTWYRDLGDMRDSLRWASQRG